MIKIILIYLLVGLGLTGQAAVDKNVIFKPSDLNSNPAEYDKHKVFVQGLITIGPESHTIYESSEINKEFRKKWDSGDDDFDPKKYAKYCLTIANPKLFYQNRSRVNGQTIIIKGKFIKNYLNDHSIDLGACPLPTAILVDEKYLLRHYPLIFVR